MPINFDPNNIDADKAQPYIDKASDVIDQAIDLVPKIEFPNILPETPNKTPTPDNDIAASDTITSTIATVSTVEQHEPDYGRVQQLLANTNYKKWSPKFVEFTDVDLRQGVYNPINGPYCIKFDANNTKFSTNIWTDIPRLMVDKDAMAAIITGLAYANANNSAVTMPVEFNKAISSGNYILDISQIAYNDHPITLLNNAFGYKEETEIERYYALNVRGFKEAKEDAPVFYDSSALILICAGDLISKWDSSKEAVIHGRTYIGLGHEIATATLIHELCHSAFPEEDENTISACALAITADFGQSIFKIAP